MKKYRIRNEKEKQLFNKVRNTYNQYLEKKEKITNIAIKSIVHLSDIIPNDLNIDWVIKDIIDTWIWKITEAPGPGVKTKYIGQRYWTKAAINRYLDNLEADKRKDESLEHEHVYLKQKMKTIILKSLNIESKIDSILKKAIACVVETAEHSKLIKGAKGWKRYLVDDIVVIDLLNEEILEHKDLKIKE